MATKPKASRNQSSAEDSNLSADALKFSETQSQHETVRQKEKTMFDINKLVVQDTTTIEIEDPNGEPLLNDDGLPLSVTVYGPGSKPFQRATGTKNRALLEHMRRGAKKMKDDEAAILDAEFLASCTVSFNNFAYQPEQFQAPGFEMFKAFYLNRSLGFIADQINKEIGDWSNFTKGSSKI